MQMGMSMRMVMPMRIVLGLWLDGNDEDDPPEADNELIVSYVVYRTKGRPTGRVDLRTPGSDTPGHYGIYFYLGRDDARGFIPVPVGTRRRIVLARAAAAGYQFAAQNACKYLRRDEGGYRLVELALPYLGRLCGATKRNGAGPAGGPPCPAGPG